MAKSKITYVCPDCGRVHYKWSGQCLGCGSWSGLIEEVEQEEVKPNKNKVVQTNRVLTNLPLSIKDVKEDNLSRVSSKISEFDTVLGGGIVDGSLVLIGGDPGIGKSTLLTQVMHNLSETYKTLYVSAEESPSQVKIRCNRLGATSNNMHLINENELESIEQILLDSDYKYVVIDSIQAVYLSSIASSSGSVTQVRECATRLMRIAKNFGITIFIIGHVTKEGNIAGPKVLEHIMDTVLYFEGENDSNFKILRAVKNRFGSTNEVGIFDMTENGIFPVENPSAIMLSNERGFSAGSVVTALCEGSRCMLIELQSLVCASVFGNPRRMSSGIDYNKLVLLIAVLEKRAGAKLYNQDVYVNAMGGIKITEPSSDLAIAVSIYSALKNLAINKDIAIFGELGLTGEVRDVYMIEKRVKECVKMGFKTIILPKNSLNKISEATKKKANLVGVRYITEALTFVKNNSSCQS